MLKQKLERMITTLLPDAIPGEDFVIQVSDNNEPTFSYWKTEKLGPPHSFDDLHSVYMRFVKARKTADPLIDDSDPMPWLTEAKERAKEEAISGYSRMFSERHSYRSRIDSRSERMLPVVEVDEFGRRGRMRDSMGRYR